MTERRTATKKKVDAAGNAAPSLRVVPDLDTPIAESPEGKDTSDRPSLQVVRAAQAQGRVANGSENGLGPPLRPSSLDSLLQSGNGTLSRETLDYIGELKGAFRRVSRDIIGRDELLAQTLFAILTREHQLIFSRAGTAKSLYASSVFEQFRGSKVFSIQMTKGTTEEGLVGAIDIDELKKGNIIHNVSGSIVEANFSFIDEVFDSNDVALRSLLGILNERKFNKGKQQVESPLHTAIATSNYVRANDVTEALIDRFGFKALLMPDLDPYRMLQVDRAYSTNIGRVSKVDENEKMPLAHLSHLADIVENRSEQERIETPYHVLFMKNAVIMEYMRLVNGDRKHGEPEIYVSPRTMAKAQDVLIASALLRGQDRVEAGDLKSLRYMVTTVGDARQEKNFNQALANIIEKFPEADLHTVDYLMEANKLFEEMIDKIDRGERIKPSLWERVKIFFNLTSEGELTFSRIGSIIQKADTSNPVVAELRDGIVCRIGVERSRLNKKPDAPLF